MIQRLIRGWGALGALAIVALLLQPSTPAILFERYSRNALTVIAALAVTLPLVVWLGQRLPAWLEQTPLTALLRGGIALAGLMAVLILWAAPVASAPSYWPLRIYLTGLAAPLIVWGLAPFPLPRWSLPALTVSLALILLGLVTRFPGVQWIDEAYMASSAVNFTRIGAVKPLIYTAVDTESQSMMYMALGVWYRLVGFGLWSGRVLIFGVGLAMLTVTAVIARRHYSASAAWVAVMVALVGVFNLNVLRQDIEVALFLALALWVWGMAECTGRKPLHVLVGFFAAFAIDGHPNAYRFSLGFGAAYVLDAALAIWDARRARRAWQAEVIPLMYLIVGGVAGVAAYIGLYTWIGKDLLAAAQDPFLPIDRPPTLIVLDQLRENLIAAPQLFGAAVLGAALGVWQRDRFARRITVILVVSAAVIALLYGYYRPYYVAQTLGLLAILAAGLFHWLMTDPKAGVRAYRAQTALGIVVFVSVVGMVARQMQNGEFSERFNDMIAIAQAARAVIPPEAVIVGSDPMYFALNDAPEFSEYAVAGWAGGKFNIAESAVWEQIAPDAVLVAYDNPLAPPPSLLDYLQANAFGMVACWHSPQVGQVDLFMRAGSASAAPTCEEMP